MPWSHPRHPSQTYIEERVRAAVIVNGHLQLQDRPTPTPRGRQVLVDVAAT
ncbi:MAG: hypothetical protein ACI970_001565, partial [Myxococcota bacterium]